MEKNIPYKRSIDLSQSGSRIVRKKGLSQESTNNFRRKVGLYEEWTEWP
jgi:hypothetical protein